MSIFHCISIILLVLGINSTVDAQNLKHAFLHPCNNTKMKTWWFFGYENTTDEGIRADIKALKETGFGGVVYYDQNHRRKDYNGPKPDDGFSPAWWHHLKYAAREAHHAGLSFELNISNGYVAGGIWIDPKHAMQRVASATVHIQGGTKVNIALPTITGPDNYVRDIAVFAFPVKDTTMMRHITARYIPKGKGMNGAMQSNLDSLSRHTFTGYGFNKMPDIGKLQVTDDCFTCYKENGEEYQCWTDSAKWHDIVALDNMYSSQGGYQWRTTAFPSVLGSCFNVDYSGDTKLRSWNVGCEAMMDRWEEKSGLQSEFIECDKTPDYSSEEVLHFDEIINVSGLVHGDTLSWQVPKGHWCILRMAAVLTGAKSKHGRNNLMGYECDKLSREAAELHWNSYVQVILDSLKAEGIDWVQGITMDSHEGGSQNWTPLMLSEFTSRRGYDIAPYLPILAGYIIDSREKTDSLLRDYRHTLSDLIRDNYYATFNRLSHERELSFTAQAIGNALCIIGDAISVKSVVDKPQGEFWTYQQQGAYDIKDCSSACHLYGKDIASTEAMTDALYTTTSSELKRVADIAFSFGAQEFVVCATPHIPLAKTFEPYIAGREYAINRSNPKWTELTPIWMQLARTMTVLREGRADPDVLVYLGDDVPMKTLTHRLPMGIEGLDWDVCTGDALCHRLSALPNGDITTPDSIKYHAIIIEKDAFVSAESAAKINSLRKEGVRILTSGECIPRFCTVVSGNASDIVFTRRKIGSRQCLFIANITDKQIFTTIQFANDAQKVELWHTKTGRITTNMLSPNKTLDIHFSPNESMFIML